MPDLLGCGSGLVCMNTYRGAGRQACPGGWTAEGTGSALVAGVAGSAWSPAETDLCAGTASLGGCGPLWNRATCSLDGLRLLSETPKLSYETLLKPSV